MCYSQSAEPVQLEKLISVTKVSDSNIAQLILRIYNMHMYE